MKKAQLPRFCFGGETFEKIEGNQRIHKGSPTKEKLSEPKKKKKVDKKKKKIGCKL